MSTCKGCGAPIDWITTKAGKHMPVDPEPVFIVMGGGPDYFITDEGDMLIGRRALPAEERPELEVAFVPHWKTCPDAGRFRRRK